MTEAERSIRQCVIGTEDCADAEAFYDKLALDLGLGDDFGRNMDALWDVLSADVAGPLELVIADPQALDTALGGNLSILMELLGSLVLERGDVRVVLGRL